MANAQSEANQRVSPRTPVGQNVWLQCRRTAPGANLANGILDISDGGVQLLCKELLQPGEIVEIVLGNAGARTTIQRRGEVRWAVPVGGLACCIGVRFIEPLSALEVQALTDTPVAAASEEISVFEF